MPDPRDQAIAEARKHIAAHCECEDNNGVRSVFRYQKGTGGYAWVPCKECAKFWLLCEQIDKDLPNPTAAVKVGE